MIFYVCSTVSLSLVFNLSLIISAPNAILNGFAGAPIPSAQKWIAYSASNSDQRF